MSNHLQNWLHYAKNKANIFPTLIAFFEDSHNSHYFDMTYPRQLDNLSQKYWELSKHETITFQIIQNDISHYIHNQRTKRVDWR